MYAERRFLGWEKEMLAEQLAREILASDAVIVECREDPYKDELVMRARVFVVEGKAAALYDRSGNKVIDATTAGQLYIGSVSGNIVGTMKIQATSLTIGGSAYGIKIEGPSITPVTNSSTVPNLGDTTHCWGGGYFKALHTNTSGLTILSATEKLGFFGKSPVAKKTVSSSGSVESVVSNLVTALKAYGLV